MIENPILKKWNNSDLVALDYWKYSGYNYSVRIRAFSSEFLFEGKKRQGQSPHINFPITDQQVLWIGGKEDCMNFLTHYLPPKGCSSDLLLELLDKVKHWRVK